jgi:hypothetical protein
MPNSSTCLEESFAAQQQARLFKQQPLVSALSQNGRQTFGYLPFSNDATARAKRNRFSSAKSLRDFRYHLLPLLPELSDAPEAAIAPQQPRF